jgi:3-oxoacyl-[acyl-carrier-protein] synthase II
MDVVVTGIGLRSALGNLPQTWQGLLAGRSGIRCGQPFAELPELPLGLLGDTPALDLRDVVVAIVTEAIADAGLSVPLVDCGVVLGSSRGNQTRLEQMLSGTVPIADWWAAQPNIAAVTAAQMLSTQAIVLAPMAACATGIGAIARGADLIRSGQCDRVLVGAVDTPVTPLTIAGFRQMGALATTGCYPFDVDREGFVLGEGGAVLVLESGALARSRGAKIYGRVMGGGLSADAYHLSSPDPQGAGAKAAMMLALNRSGLGAESIDYIHAHGTATRLNDATEAAVIGAIFGDRSPWVSSTKGATGHTLGGSSALGAAICLMALGDHRVPGCVGLGRSDLSVKLAQTTVSADLDYALCNGFGFGGQNGAIVFGRGDRLGRAAARPYGD